MCRLASGIEAVLHSGIKVNAYYYVDMDPVAREIAQFRLANLSAKVSIALSSYGMGSCVFIATGP
jgi:hypothetical protein